MTGRQQAGRLRQSVDPLLEGDADGNLGSIGRRDQIGSHARVGRDAAAAPESEHRGELADDGQYLRFGTRDYDSQSGRWTAKDPVLFAGGDANIYSYLANDPINWVDSSGLLACWWHFELTLSSGLRSHYGWSKSLGLAWDAVLADWGSQGYDAASTAQHAMAGMLPNGKPEGSSQAIDNAKRFVARNRKTGNLGKAVHAAQDLATPGHAGKPWGGFGWNWETVAHIWGDTFPSLNTLVNALQNSYDAMQR